MDEWEHDYDEGNANSVPDCIPEVEAAELASWLQAKKCVLLDCREAVEAKYERRATATQIPKSLRIGFGDLRALPHTLLKDLSQLKDNTCDIVTFSTHGGTSGNCGAFVYCLPSSLLIAVGRLTGNSDDIQHKPRYVCRPAH